MAYRDDLDALRAKEKELERELDEVQRRLGRRDESLALGMTSPCDMPWSAMRGDDTVRFCDKCEKNVYDARGLTLDEIERLVSRTEGACLRLLRRPDGTVVTADCPAPGRRLVRLALVGAVTGALSLGATAGAMATIPTEEPEEPVPNGQWVVGKLVKRIGWGERAPAESRSTKNTEILGGVRDVRYDVVAAEREQAERASLAPPTIEPGWEE